MQVKQIEKGSDFVHLKVIGQVSESHFEPNCEPLAEYLPESLDKLHLHLDMSDTDFIDSSGVGWLIRWNQKMEDHQGALLLHAPTPNVQRAIQLLKLDRLLKIRTERFSPFA